MKPSSRVIEILRGLQMENHSDIEIDFLRFHSVLQYLDEQAESQEPKALEEKPLCAHAAGICRGNCKPQEEPKKCPPFHHMHTKDGDWSNLSLEEAKKEGITLYPCKKETEPKENIENWAHRIYNADTEYDAQELLKLFIKSQEQE